MTFSLASLILVHMPLKISVMTSRDLIPPGSPSGLSRKSTVQADPDMSKDFNTVPCLTNTPQAVWTLTIWDREPCDRPSSALSKRSKTDVQVVQQVRWTS